MADPITGEQRALVRASAVEPTRDLLVSYESALQQAEEEYARLVGIHTDDESRLYREEARAMRARHSARLWKRLAARLRRDWHSAKDVVGYYRELSDVQGARLTEAERRLGEVRREALEEAAKIAEQAGDAHHIEAEAEDVERRCNIIQARALSAWRVAGSIRALATQAPAGEPDDEVELDYSALRAECQVRPRPLSADLELLGDLANYVRDQGCDGDCVADIGEPCLICRANKYDQTKGHNAPAGEPDDGAPLDDSALCDLLSLAIDHRPDENLIAHWTPDERETAAEWASAIHLRAGDHDDVDVPEEPGVVWRLRKRMHDTDAPAATERGEE